jgi:hypothetical protein
MVRDPDVAAFKCPAKLLRPPVIFKIAAIAFMFKPSFDPDNSTFGLVFESGIVVPR